MILHLKSQNGNMSCSIDHYWHMHISAIAPTCIHNSANEPPEDSLQAQVPNGKLLNYTCAQQSDCMYEPFVHDCLKGDRAGFMHTL